MLGSASPHAILAQITKLTFLADNEQIQRLPSRLSFENYIGVTSWADSEVEEFAQHTNRNWSDLNSACNWHWPIKLNRYLGASSAVSRRMSHLRATTKNDTYFKGVTGQVSNQSGERRFCKANQFGGTPFMNFPRPLRVCQQGSPHAHQIEVTPVEAPQEFI